MVIVAQLVRALDCGSRGRRFEPGLSPKKNATPLELLFLFTKKNAIWGKNFQAYNLGAFTLQ